MTKDEGGLVWSQDHNSRFEVNKSAIMHISRRTQASLEDETLRTPLERPPLKIDGQIIQDVNSYKYLGVMIDLQIRWNTQSQRTIANATKWIMKFRRLTKPTQG
jgi:hypothetical protein